MPNTQMVSAYLDDETVEAVKTLARSEQRSISWVMVQALNEYLSRPDTAAKIAKHEKAKAPPRGRSTRSV